MVGNFYILVFLFYRPWSSDKDQKEREKVLLITPVLAREATERSRRLALQSKQRSLV